MMKAIGKRGVECSKANVDVIPVAIVLRATKFEKCCCGMAVLSASQLQKDKLFHQN